MTRDKVLFHLGAADLVDARDWLAQFTLEGRAAKILQPLLVVFGRQDRIVPSSHAERLAAEAPNSTLVMHERGNHGCTNLPDRCTGDA